MLPEILGECMFDAGNVAAAVPDDINAAIVMKYGIQDMFHGKILVAL